MAAARVKAAATGPYRTIPESSGSRGEEVDLAPCGLDFYLTSVRAPSQTSSQKSDLALPSTTRTCVPCVRAHAQIEHLVIHCCMYMYKHQLEQQCHS